MRYTFDTTPAMLAGVLAGAVIAGMMVPSHACTISSAEADANDSVVGLHAQPDGTRSGLPLADPFASAWVMPVLTICGIEPSCVPIGDFLTAAPSGELSE
jgi:hypothetical protein